MDVKRLLRNKLTAKVGQKFVAGGEEYQLQGKLGDGAIGVVRKAKRLRSGNLYAVKFLAPELKYIEISSFEDISARFRREGLRGESLEHENLVKIIAYEENEGGEAFKSKGGPKNPFVVMEYVRGRTLEDHILKYSEIEPSLNVNRPTLSIAASITEALVYLHEKKLVHRDVKPANIYISSVRKSHVPSVVKLGDFGVVKWGDFKASLTTGTLTASGHQGLGTWKYMSPEQATRPKDVNVRSDMYSLGITLFELFTNQILPSPHHVFQLTRQRLRRSGNVMSRLYELDLGIVPSNIEPIFSLVYDTMLTGPSSRPSSINMLGNLKSLSQQYE